MAKQCEICKRFMLEPAIVQVSALDPKNIRPIFLCKECAVNDPAYKFLVELSTHEI